MKTQTVASLPGTVDAESAREIADEYVINCVGDLLVVGIPRLSPHGLWTMPIEVGNAVQGMLGEVGTISVDARTGQVLFTEADRAKVRAGARRLVTASAP